jgi:hypothetical protein
MLKNIIVGLVITSSVGACTVEGQAHVVAPVPVATVEVNEAPPPPQEEVVVERPGYFFIRGRHEWVGGRYVWRPGRYEAVRSGQAWEAGRWEQRGGRHVWVEGRWRSAPHATVIVH